MSGLYATTVSKFFSFIAVSTCIALIWQDLEHFISKYRYLQLRNSLFHLLLWFRKAVNFHSALPACRYPALSLSKSKNYKATSPSMNYLLINYMFLYSQVSCLVLLRHCYSMVVFLLFNSLIVPVVNLVVIRSKANVLFGSERLPIKNITEREQ